MNDTSDFQFVFQYFVRSLNKGENTTTPCGIDIPATQAHILMTILNNMPLELSPADLAKKLNLNKSNISRACDSLSTKGLLNKIKSSTDKRAYILNLSTKGSKLAKKLSHSSKKYMESVLSDFSKNERKIIIKAVEKMATLSNQQNKG